MYCNECGKYFEGVGDYCPRCVKKLGIVGGYDVGEKGLGLGISGDTGDPRSTAKDKAVGFGQLIVGALIIAYGVFRLAQLGGAINPNWRYIASFGEVMAVVVSRVGVAEAAVGGLFGYSLIFAVYILIGALIAFSGFSSITNASGLGASKAANRIQLLLFFYVIGSSVYSGAISLINQHLFPEDLFAIVLTRGVFDILCGLVILIFVGSYNIAKKRRAREAKQPAPK